MSAVICLAHGSGVGGRTSSWSHSQSPLIAIESSLALVAIANVEAILTLNKCNSNTYRVHLRSTHGYAGSGDADFVIFSWHDQN